MAVCPPSGPSHPPLGGHRRVSDDPAPGIDAERLRLLLWVVCTAAGGVHEEWDEYDRMMAAERRAVVLVVPDRVYGNG
ncbi:hypothetical protein IU450_24390 [Nocardia abscessus]|uniref:hypothetical protein n=1 Tax=Nocardia abscessus TaxID=120957 RepID=UPI001892D2ED|nr:hypothetical protein [Nocardia abscessus]